MTKYVAPRTPTIPFRRDPVDPEGMAIAEALDAAARKLARREDLPPPVEFRVSHPHERTTTWPERAMLERMRRTFVEAPHRGLTWADGVSLSRLADDVIAVASAEAKDSVRHRYRYRYTYSGEEGLAALERVTAGMAALKGTELEALIDPALIARYKAEWSDRLTLRTAPLK
jgi:hypothetical protein